MKKTNQAKHNLLLINARKDRGWKQRDVASALNTSSNLISRWERGLVFPGPYHRQALCKLFDMEAEELGLSQIALDSSRQAKLNVRVGTLVIDPSVPSLPNDLGTLIGRESVLAETRKLLIQSEGKRLSLAFYGAPGVGKTAIVTQLAYDSVIRKKFEDGILWAAVGPKTPIINVLSRWGTLLDVTSTGKSVADIHTVIDWELALQRLIGTRKMLLIIDDIWRSDDASILNACGPYCACIITTRFPKIAVSCAGRSAYAIRELDDEQGIDVLKQFIPEVVEKERKQIFDIVHAVGGLPLALVILGKYLQVETKTYGGQRRHLYEALQKLQDSIWRLQLEQETERGTIGDSAIRSVYAAISLSTEHLDEHVRNALYALSIFPAKPHSFSEEAALSVATTTIATLDALTRASLLEPIETERYTMHQTIADYGTMHSHDITLETRRRLIHYYVSYVESHQDDFPNLSIEMDNIALALKIAHEEGTGYELIHGACAWTPFLLARGLYEEAELHLNRAHQAAKLYGDESLLARVLLCLGQLAERHKALPQAIPYYKEGLTLARSIHNSDLLLDFLVNLGEVTLNLGDHTSAESYVREGLALVYEDRLQKCKLLKALGEIVDLRGEFAQADVFYEQALEIARTLHDREMMSVLLQNLGAKAFKENRFEEADTFCQEGLAFARDMGSLHRQSALLVNLSMIAIRSNRYEQAESYCQEALEITHKMKNDLRMSNALQNFGILEGLRDHGELAEAYLNESIKLARKINHQWLISEGLGELGEVYLRQEKIADAKVAFEEALDIAQTKQFQELLAVALFGLARVAKEQGDIELARQLGEESQALFKKEGHYKLDVVIQWFGTLPVFSTSLNED